MAFFKPKLVGKDREREKIKKKSFWRVPTIHVIENLKKKAKKLKKLKKQHYGFFSSKNELGNAEKEKK